jgi:hypothetical protein
MFWHRGNIHCNYFLLCFGINVDDWKGGHKACDILTKITVTFISYRNSLTPVEHWEENCTSFYVHLSNHQQWFLQILHSLAFSVILSCSSLFVDIAAHFAHDAFKIKIPNCATVWKCSGIHYWWSWNVRRLYILTTICIHVDWQKRKASIYYFHVMWIVCNCKI